MLCIGCVKVKNKILFYCLFLGALIFYGCTKSHEINNNLGFVEKTFLLKIEEESFILAVACIKTYCRFSLLSFLGFPIVDRIFQNGKFHNAKFLPPNSTYDDLFLKIIQDPNAQSFNDQNITLKVVEND